MNKEGSRKFTDEQNQAISARGCNLLVSAAAGAGKTAVLVERILGLIMDSRHPVDIDRLLVVTFTNAAAAEMRERIAQAISSGLREGGDSGRLSLQLALLSRARITTIHSFCLDVLKQYFYRTDLDPGFRIADETESALLKADVLEELLEDQYSGRPENSGFDGLAECYGGDLDDSALMRLVIEIYDFSRSSPNPSGWLEKMASKFGFFGGGADIAGHLAAGVLSGVAGSLEGALAELEAALVLCRKPGGPAQYAPAVENDIVLIRELIGFCRKDWDAAHRAFAEMRFASLKKGPAGIDEKLKGQVMAMRNRAKKTVNAAGGTILARPLAEHASDLEKAAPVVRALVRLVAEFAVKYRLAKVSRGLVDFGDLEHYCLEILGRPGKSGETEPTEVALELRDQFEEVLVDEYQDINLVQEAIIKLVARPRERGPNLFMVGDVKQSIYRFRLADPALFLEKHSAYSFPGGERGRLINLSRNFRSRREIIDAVNYIFRNIMQSGAAELDYGPEAELVYGAGVHDNRPEGLFADRRVELHLLDRAGPDPGNRGEVDTDAGDAPEDHPVEGSTGFLPEDDPGTVQAEARLAAGRIRDLIEGGMEIYDSGLKSFRPAEYRDVVVLMRSTRGKAATFADEMKSMGVPACAEPDTGYFQSAEIETMISLLSILDNPRQDIPLAAVLRSPVVGLDAGELALLRLARRTGDLWDAVIAASREVGEMAGRLSKFTGALDRWRDLGRRSTMTDLIWTIYRETGYYHYAGAMPGGAQRQANLRALHHWAGKYEATTFRGIFTFLRFIERMRERGEDPGRARTLAENENAVRIMSIHKSKGLEFPVVVIPGLGGRFNLKDLGGRMLMHREMGFGPALVDTENRITYPTLAWLAVRERLRRESLAEEMRILYVAMTRAREKLVLIGSTADFRQSSETWSRNTHRAMTGAEILNARSFLDWICPALARHQDGAVLREAGAGEDCPPAEKSGPSRWLVKVTGAAGPGEAPGSDRALQPSGDILERIRRGERIEGQGRYAGEVQRRLSWVYPAREAAGKPSKVSVTGLGETAEAAPPGAARDGETPAAPPGQRPSLPFLRPAYARPAFMLRKRELTAAERGSALHTVMRHLDLGGNLDSEGVAEQVRRMRERELITGDQAASVDCLKVARFFQSSLGRRVLAAGSVKRELTFSLAVPAEDVYHDLKGGASGERVLVQGVIDCLADEGDGYLLIDYKTDRLVRVDSGALAGKYGSQMDWYARAVEALTSRPVKERRLYFFEAGFDLRV